MQKRETIYNFRIEVEGYSYRPQYNHPEHGWVNIRLAELNREKIDIISVFLDISTTNDYIEIENSSLALAVINHYKDVNSLDNIKKEYFYIE